MFVMRWGTAVIISLKHQILNPKFEMLNPPSLKLRRDITEKDKFKIKKPCAEMGWGFFCWR